MLSVLRKSLWLFSLAVLLLILFLPGYIKLKESRVKNRQLEENFRRIAIENSLLQEELRRVQNDPLYQEKLARDKMGVVRKGEIPVKIFSGKKQENRFW